MRKLIFLVQVLAFLALATWFALALRPDHDPRELPSALLDKPAPDFVLPSLGGGEPVSDLEDRLAAKAQLRQNPPLAPSRRAFASDKAIESLFEVEFHLLGNCLR